MLRNFYILLIFILLASCQNSDKNDNSIQVLFAGDILLDRGVKERIEHLGPGALFHPSIDSIFRQCDFVIANLECPATKVRTPINKKYIFRAEPELLKTLKEHQVSHLNMANNHSMDQGRSGLQETYFNILKYGMTPLGYGENLKQACKPELITSKPRKIYLLSSLQVPSENWTYLENSPCVCEESIKSIINQITFLKTTEPNCVVIIQLHWGIEHTQTPLISQKQHAHSLIDSGADCVIGHHSHTIQIVENYKGKTIFYSIGNFIFDQSKPINSEGLMVKLLITTTDIKLDTIRFFIDKCSPKIKKYP